MADGNWDKEWHGLEPEQPQSGQCGCWIGALILLVALFATCLGTGYFAWRQLDLPIDPGAVLLPATVAPLATPSSIDGVTIATPETEIAATPPPLVATVTLASGGVVEPEIKDAVVVRQLFEPPLIDGNLDEWQSANGYESLFLVYTAESWDGTDDVYAAWRLGWDRENLYGAVRVEDDVHVQTQRGRSIFRGDGVSMQLDTELADNPETRLSPDNYQINLSPGDFAGNPPAVHRFRADSTGTLVDMAGPGAQIAALQSTDGYALEFAIPWSDLGIAPSPGFRMGIALNVNDNDTPGTAVQEVMKSHVATRRFSDPSSWGSLVLE